MKRSVGKKGSHVGIMISFTIFILSISFLYIILKPAISFRDKQNQLDNLKERIIELSSAEMEVISVSVGSRRNCVILNNFLTDEMGGKVAGRSDSGEIIQLRGYPNNNNLQVLSNNNVFFRIYSSEEFPEIERRNFEEQCSATTYEKGILKKENKIFESRIREIIEYYNRDYRGLKNELEISPADEFALDFVYSDGTILSTGEVNFKGDFFIKEYPITYIKEDASTEAGVLKIKLW